LKLKHPETPTQNKPGSVGSEEKAKSRSKLKVGGFAEKSKNQEFFIESS